MEATEVLIADHRAVRNLFGRFERSSRPETRQAIAQELIRELSVHAAIEEAKLYPVIRKELPGGEDMYKESIDEHQQVKEILAKLDKTLDKAHTKAFGDQITRLKRDVEHHVKEEETEMFPLLRETLSQSRLEELGAELKRAKSTAPTRPHPNQPPATNLTGRAVGAVDKVRDKVSGR